MNLGARLMPIYNVFVEKHPNITYKELQELYKNGERDDTIAYMYVKNIGLFQTYWNKYKYHYEFDIEMFEVSVLEGISKGLNEYDLTYANGYKSLTGYCAACAQWRMLHYKSGIRRAAHSQKRKDTVVHHLEHEIQTAWGGTSTLAETIEDVNVQSDYRCIDYDDLIKQASLSDRDMLVLNMVINGYTQTEIAKEVNLTQAGVARVIKMYREKFRKAAAA